MKVDELNKAKIPVVKINKKLEEFRGKILFPKKLALANEMLSRVKLPISETSKWLFVNWVKHNYVFRFQM